MLAEPLCRETFLLLPEEQPSEGGHFEAKLDYWHPSINGRILLDETHVESDYIGTASDTTGGAMLAVGLHAGLNPLTCLRFEGRLSESTGVGPEIGEAEIKVSLGWDPVWIELGYRYLTPSKQQERRGSLRHPPRPLHGVRPPILIEPPTRLTPVRINVR